MSRRDKSTKKRSIKTTILVVTNGEVTEHRYLEWLRDKVNGPREKVFSNGRSYFGRSHVDTSKSNRQNV